MPFFDPVRRRPQIPAWIVSMLVHTLLFVLLFLWVQRPNRGAAEETLRDVGIVVKRMTADGVKFDGENDTPADRTADVDSPNPQPSEAAQLLPDMATNSQAAESLPQLPSVGAADSSDASAAAAAAAGGGTTGGAPGEIGEKTTVKVFGVEGTGSKFVYLFDRSASMDGVRLRAAKQQLIASLDSLEEIHRFHIIFFNGATPLHAQLNVGRRNRIAFATEQNKKLATSFVQSVTAFGGTDRETALTTALGLGPDVIFFLTDADNEMSRDEMSKVYRLQKRHGTTICTIEFGVGPRHGRRNFLTQLAESTGGTYNYVNTNNLGAPQP